MLSNDLTEIILLHPVHINYSLRKHTKKDDGDSAKMSVAGGSFNDSDSNNEWPRRDSNTWNGVPFSIRTQFNSPVKRAIAEAYVRFRLLFVKPMKDPVEIFDEVKGNFLELGGEKVDDAEMKSLLKKLEITKQCNVIDEIKQKAIIEAMEHALYNAGFKQYQTEAALISFIKRVKKGLCLTEIENFDRVIPDEVSKRLATAEELAVFDNYYILHYDPKKGANPYYTEKEPKPKDPVLFGVIRGSDKLYFIADWIDEFCSLTYKEILKHSCDYTIKKP